MSTPNLRYTGDFPPLDILRRHPNWEYALDEVCVAGQDETTIRPSANQVSLDPEIAFTAGWVTRADGERLPAMLELFDEVIVGVTAHVEGEWTWTLRRVGRQKTWTPIELEFLPESERPESIQLSDPAVFPLLVEAVLPGSADGPSPRFTIQRDA